MVWASGHSSVTGPNSSGQYTYNYYVENGNQVIDQIEQRATFSAPPAGTVFDANDGLLFVAPSATLPTAESKQAVQLHRWNAGKLILADIAADPQGKGGILDVPEGAWSPVFTGSTTGFGDFIIVSTGTDDPAGDNFFGDLPSSITKSITGQGAAFALLEAVGQDSDQVLLDQSVRFLTVDAHSDEGTYLKHPLRPPADGSPRYSYERWIRYQFTPPFGAVKAFRFWIDPVDIPIGWTLRWGVSDVYVAPSNGPSGYALNDLPVADPGENFPNAGGETPLPGTKEQYSKWIVLQASTSAEAVEGSELSNLMFHFAWVDG